MLEDQGIHEDAHPGPGEPDPDAERFELEALEAEEDGAGYYDPGVKRRKIERKQQEHAAAKLGEKGWTRKVEAETAVPISVRVTPKGGGIGDSVTTSEPVGVRDLHRLSPEGAADVLHDVTAALENVPADRQEEVYHNVRDDAIKSLQGRKGSRRAAEAFVDRHLSEPLGERSPYTNEGQLRDVDVLDLEPPAMLVEDLIPAGEVGIITGDSGTGKSWLVSELTHAVAFGGSWLGQPVETMGHVRLFLPEGRASFPERLAGKLIRSGELEPGATRSDLSEALSGRVSITSGHTVLDDPRLEDHLRADVGENGTRLVVFDTLNRSLGAGQDENDANDASAVVNMLHRLAADTGCTFLLIHHPPHGEKRERGSRVWRDAPDFRFLIYGTDKDVRRGKPVTLWNVKQRNIPPADEVAYRLAEHTVQYDGETVTTCDVQRAAVVTDVPVADRIRWFVDEHPGSTKSAVLSNVEGRNDDVSSAIDRLLADGKLRNANEGSGPWALHVAGEWEPAEEAFDAEGPPDLSDLTGEASQEGGSDA